MELPYYFKANLCFSQLPVPSAAVSFSASSSTICYARVVSMVPCPAPPEDVSASRAGIFVTCIHPRISGSAPGTEEHQNEYCLSKDDPRRPGSWGSASGPLPPDAQLPQQGVLELLGSLRGGRSLPPHTQRLKLHQIPSPAPPHHCLSA